MRRFAWATFLLIAIIAYARTGPRWPIADLLLALGSISLVATWLPRYLHVVQMRPQLEAWASYRRYSLVAVLPYLPWLDVYLLFLPSTSAVDRFPSMSDRRHALAIRIRDSVGQEKAGWANVYDESIRVRWSDGESEVVTWGEIAEKRGADPMWDRELDP